MRSALVVFTFSIAMGSLAQFPKGEVIDSILCIHDKNQSYSLYLPSYYSEDRLWPVIYFFEPAARGNLPIKKYHTVAEELGFILVCSNNSKNGPWEVAFEAADAVFQDTQNRFSVDHDMFFTSGFSGGSRLALTVAVMTGQIRGVIGVGAARSSPEHQLGENADLLYVGLVGNRDMNYQEHITFTRELEKLEIENFLIVSTRDHQWAPYKDFRLALAWILQQISTKKESGSTELLDNLLEKKLVASRDSIGLSDILRIEQALRNIEQSQVSELSERERNKIFKKEIKLARQELSLRIQLRDSMDIIFNSSGRDIGRLNWIIKKAKGYRLQIEKSKDVEKALMLERVLNFLGAMAIETSMLHIYRKQYDMALVGIKVWYGVTKNQMYGNWWFAKIYALKGDSTKSIGYLEEMVEMGFKNKNALETEVAFSDMRKTEKFQKLIDKMGN